MWAWWRGSPQRSPLSLPLLNSTPVKQRPGVVSSPARSPAAKQGEVERQVERFRPTLGMLVLVLLLAGPQLGLRAHLQAWWFTALLAAGEALRWCGAQPAFACRTAPFACRTAPCTLGLLPRPSAAAPLLVLITCSWRAGALVLLRRLLAFRRWGDETAHLRAFAAALAWLLLVVTLENFATWAVAASDQHKYDYTPLQVGRGGAEERVSFALICPPARTTAS